MRYNQPQGGPLQIDRANPLGAKVVEHIALNGQLRTAVAGNFGTRDVGGSYAITRKGSGLRGAGAGSRGSIPLNLSRQSKITLAFWLYWDAFANDDAFAMELTPNTNSNAGAFYVDPNAANGQFAFVANGSGANGKGGVCARPTSGAWHRYAITVDIVTQTVGIAIDGVAVSTSDTVGTPQTTGTVFANSTLHLLSRAGTGLFGTGNLQDITIYNGLLSAQEIAADFNNPWQIFKTPQPIYLYKAAAAGGGASYALTCAAGAYSLTGSSATLQAAHRVAAAQGSYTLTGNPAALQAGHRMTAAAGSYTVTGNAATLTYAPTGLVMPAAGGSYSITGNAVTMRAAHRLVCEAGSYTLTGNAVTTPGEEVPPVSGGGGGVSGGGRKEVRAFADLLDKARPTKTAKKRLRRVLEAEALELLPDEPESIKAASIIAQVVAKKELQAIERRPVTAEPLAQLPFDPTAEIQRMVDEWMQNEAIRRELEDEEDIEMLLLG